MTYRYQVLGTTRAIGPDGRAVPLAGLRLRALLAALAAAGGRAVPAGDLADRVWGEDGRQPADVPAALQALVGRLRRVLGRTAVGSVSGGYRLVADRDDIDLFRFERLAAEGAAALEADQPAEAAALLDEGLALWRGPALADLPGADLDPLAVRAGRRRSEAQYNRLAADVALGRASAVLGELTQLAAEAPLDEPLQALRIRALRATGRQAEALQAYEEVRAALADRLGAGPGSELRDLHAGLLEDSGRAVAPSRPAAPALPCGNLRARLTSFVGREAEMADVAAQLEHSRLVTLLGPGGAGKTRLALEAAAAAEATGAWTDGVWVAELAPVGDAGTVPETVLTALGARGTQLRRDAGPEPAHRDLIAQLVEVCGRRRMLLVLDNCEHVVDASARLAEAVLTGCPGVQVLATSREPLGVPGESVRVVGPLPQDMALRLLADRGASARPGFSADDDPDACAEICLRLDGLPLALELAAARVRALTPRQIADRLDDRFRLLTGGSRTLLPRQQTLRAVVDWSWDLLTDDERAVLRRLAVFSGGCALEQAEAVCGAAALDQLASLVDKSLVVASPGGPDGMRYGLLETVAEYAAERLDESGERAGAELRHLTAYRELVRTGDPELRGPRQGLWLARFETEHDNVRSALRTAVRLGEEQEALCLVRSMSWFWQQRSHQADARTWAPSVAALGPDPFVPPVRTAVPVPERAIAAPPPWPDEVLWEARRGVRLIVLATGDDAAEPDRPETQRHLRAVVSAYRSGLPQLRTQPASMWFIARLLTGEFPGLGDAVDAVVAEFGDDQDGWGFAFTLLMRARLLGDRQGGLDSSLQDAGRALALFEAAGDQWGIAESLSARGEALDAAGRHHEAAADFERAMDCSARVGAHAQAPVFAARLAAARMRTAVTPAERERAERALVDAARDSHRYATETMGTPRLLLVHHYGRTGRSALAREQLREMEQELADRNTGLFAGLLAGVHGWLDCVEGDYEAARARTGEAVRRLDHLAYLVAPHLIVDQFLCAAWAMAHGGASSDGARLLGVYDRADHVPGWLGLRVFGDETVVRRRAERDLREALGAAAFEQAYARGRDLAVREAAALI
ncbi:NB-ARC domain-containing protein [Streptomyces sp. NBC_00390]|uniref:ATP-binding protein n=1 Tax=Streptomyces sp. NBC_00390 TaxID=2975736 RepID=UPI002E211CF0